MQYLVQALVSKTVRFTENVETNGLTQALELTVVIFSSGAKFLRNNYRTPSKRYNVGEDSFYEPYRSYQCLKIGSCGMNRQFWMK